MEAMQGPAKGQRPPEQLLRHGLADHHPYPLVGWRTTEGIRSKRTQPADAWSFPLVEHRTGSSFTGIFIDVDHEPGLVQDRVDSDAIPQPSVWTIRRSSAHSHVGFFLREPVHRYPHASDEPLRFLGHVTEYMRAALKGDPGYNGVLFANATHADYHAVYGPNDGYSLTELAEYVPATWKPGPVPTTGIGRAVDLYVGLMRYAGSNPDGDLDAEANRIVATFDLYEPHAFMASETRAIVRTVERYRVRWAAKGWHTPRWIARQAARGRASGRARRQRTHDRDAAIVAAYKGGTSQRELGNRFGLTKRGIKAVLARHHSSKTEVSP